MNTDPIAMTTRDQIALDIYKLLVVIPERKHISTKEEARTAYGYADAFLIEQKVQASTTESLTPPFAPPALEKRKTVMPVVGRRYYTRSGQTATVDSFSSHGGIYTVIATNTERYVVDLIGQANDPANDLVDECPF